MKQLKKLLFLMFVGFSGSQLVAMEPEIDPTETPGLKLQPGERPGNLTDRLTPRQLQFDDTNQLGPAASSGIASSHPAPDAVEDWEKLALTPPAPRAGLQTGESSFSSNVPVRAQPVSLEEAHDLINQPPVPVRVKSGLWTLQDGQDITQLADDIDRKNNISDGALESLFSNHGLTSHDQSWEETQTEYGEYPHVFNQDLPVSPSESKIFTGSVDGWRNNYQPKPENKLLQKEDIDGLNFDQLIAELDQQKEQYTGVTYQNMKDIRNPIFTLAIQDPQERDNYLTSLLLNDIQDANNLLAKYDTSDVLSRGEIDYVGRSLMQDAYLTDSMSDEQALQYVPALVNFIEKYRDIAENVLDDLKNTILDDGNKLGYPEILRQEFIADHDQENEAGTGDTHVQDDDSGRSRIIEALSKLQTDSENSESDDDEEFIQPSSNLGLAPIQHEGAFGHWGVARQVKNKIHEKQVKQDVIEELKKRVSDAQLESRQVRREPYQFPKIHLNSSTVAPTVSLAPLASASGAIGMTMASSQTAGTQAQATSKQALSKKEHKVMALQKLRSDNTNASEATQKEIIKELRKSKNPSYVNDVLEDLEVGLTSFELPRLEHLPEALEQNAGVSPFVASADTQRTTIRNDFAKQARFSQRAITLQPFALTALTLPNTPSSLQVSQLNVQVQQLANQAQQFAQEKNQKQIKEDIDTLKQLNEEVTQRLDAYIKDLQSNSRDPQVKQTIKEIKIYKKGLQKEQRYLEAYQEGINDVLKHNQKVVDFYTEVLNTDETEVTVSDELKEEPELLEDEQEDEQEAEKEEEEDGDSEAEEVCSKKMLKERMLSASVGAIFAKLEQLRTDLSEDSVALKSTIHKGIKDIVGDNFAQAKTNKFDDVLDSIAKSKQASKNNHVLSSKEREAAEEPFKKIGEELVMLAKALGRIKSQIRDLSIVNVQYSDKPICQTLEREIEDLNAQLDIVEQLLKELNRRNKQNLYLIEQS